MVLHKRYDITAGVAQQVYEMSGYLSLTAGQVVYPVIAQNGGTSTTEADISATANLTWGITAV